MPLNWYYSMKKYFWKHSDNFWHRKLTLKVRNPHFSISWSTKKNLRWKSAIYHSINVEVLKNLKWYLVNKHSLINSTKHCHSFMLLILLSRKVSLKCSSLKSMQFFHPFQLAPWREGAPCGCKGGTWGMTLTCMKYLDFKKIPCDVNGIFQLRDLKISRNSS
jgi:hypothetical protein